MSRIIVRSETFQTTLVVRFLRFKLCCKANCYRISDVQKLIQNVAKCKKLKSISRKHGSLKFEPVSYVSATM